MPAYRYIPLALVAVAPLLGCRTNPRYCEDHVGNNCDAPPIVIDGQQGCVSNEHCTSPTATVCDTATSTCVQCTASQASACTGATPVCDATASVCVQCTADQPAACTGATPVCSAAQTCIQCTPQQSAACTGTTPICGANNQCQACNSHAECSTSVCLVDGSCASPAQVAYVAPGGSDNSMCTKENPCIRVASALGTGRPIIKFSGVTNELVTVMDQNVMLVGEPDAQLTSTSEGILLEIRGTSHVAIMDLTITGADGGAGVGIGISMPGGLGSLTIFRSTISNNAAGGISIGGGVFVIVGNVFLRNGADDSTVGGLVIRTGSNMSNRLEFNSFSRNQAAASVGAAIDCVVGLTFTARNNIMSGIGTQEQFSGSCTHAYSIVLPGTVPPGMNNSNSDPLFVDAASGNLHLQANSPARRAADPSSDRAGIAARDIDGDRRVAPADIGADQVP